MNTNQINLEIINRLYDIYYHSHIIPFRISFGHDPKNSVNSKIEKKTFN